MPEPLIVKIPAPLRTHDAFFPHEPESAAHAVPGNSASTIHSASKVDSIRLFIDLFSLQNYDFQQTPLGDIERKEQKERYLSASQGQCPPET